MLSSELNIGAVPRVDAYFGPWCIREAEGLELFAQCRRVDLLTQHIEHVRQAQASTVTAQAISVAVQSGIAVIPVAGVMMKAATSFGGTSTVHIRQQIRAARDSDDVGGILLVWDTPGGSAAGTHELAEEIRNAAAIKPVHSFGDGMVCSAGFWCASQAQFFSAGVVDIIGSIGTMITIEDTSTKAANEGRDVHLVATGNLKGSGTAGTPVTQDQLDHLKMVVNAINEPFQAAVQMGRTLTGAALAAVSTGGVWVGQEAVAVGLIDTVENFDAAFERLAAIVEARQTEDVAATVVTKTQETPAMTVATLKELRAACPNATDEFLLEQIDGDATVDAAKADWLAHQELAMEARAKELDLKELELKAKADRQVEPVGATIVADNATAVAPDDEEDGEPLLKNSTGDIVADFENAHAKLSAELGNRADAMVRLATQNPEAHGRYVSAVNGIKKDSDVAHARRNRLSRGRVIQDS